MTATITATSATTRTLEFSLSTESIQPAFEKKVDKYRKEIVIKGFRPGKVPRNVLLQRFGEGIRQEAIDETINELVRSELEQAGIKPVTTGQLKDYKDNGESGISFAVVVEVDPPIDIKGWESLGISVPPVVVNEAEVHDELQSLRRRLAEEMPVDRPAETGDLVKGSYLSVVVDGEEQPLPEDPSFRSVLGESSTIGFDDGLLGAMAGTTKEILFSYPADHKDAKYAGKTAQFRVAVDAVLEIVLPAMDEAFFKKVGVDNQSDLESKIREGMTTRKQQNAKAEAQEQALEELMRINQFEVPAARVRQWAQHQFRRHMGKDQETEVPELGQETVVALRPQAERELRKARILEDLVGKMDIKTTQEEVDNRIREMSTQYGVDFEQFKSHLRQSGRIINLREELKIERVLDRLVGIK